MLQCLTSFSKDQKGSAKSVPRLDVTGAGSCLRNNMARDWMRTIDNDIFNWVCFVAPFRSGYSWKVPISGSQARVYGWNSSFFPELGQTMMCPEPRLPLVSLFAFHTKFASNLHVKSISEMSSIVFSWNISAGRLGPMYPAPASCGANAKCSVPRRFKAGTNWKRPKPFRRLLERKRIKRVPESGRLI